jgi:hypothetical protein
MATRTITTDDITGKTIDGTVHKATVGTTELEVSEDTNTALEALAAGDLATFYAYLKPYITKAAKSGDELDTATVRAWGMAQVMDKGPNKGARVFPDLKDRGRVHADVFAAYRLAFPES